MISRQKSRLIVLSIGVLLGSCVPAALEERMEMVPFHFDAGNGEQSGQEYAFNIPASMKYDDTLGLGWTTDVSEEFYHEEWEASRNSTTIDGVVAPRIGWKSDLPDGKWWLSIWLDGGLEDSSTVSLTINGKQEPLEFQYFKPHAEHAGLRPAPQKMYRILQRNVLVEDGELAFELIGGRDEVRLLGFSLIPDESVPTNIDQEKAFEALGNQLGLQNEISYQDVLKTIDEIPDGGKNRSFKAYWKQQLQIMQEAEMYFYYRGWSWATDKTGLSLFDHLHQSVMLYDGLLNRPDAAESPLYERALWYRGRLLYWLWLERHGEGEGINARRDLAMMYELHPENELVQMYNGENIDSKDEFDIEKPDGAPNWAFLQWELSNRLKSIADWWVLEQQSENGEFGGKFGDDVEILRWWSPLILSGDSIAFQGWKKLADGVWNSNRVYKGYAKKPSDVEHSSEFISDTAPLMVLFSDDPEYVDRLKYSSDHFINLWTDFNDLGFRQFKSSWYSSTELEMEPPKNRDVAYNGRATKAVRYYAWKTGDEATLQALKEWMDGWIDASSRLEKGKPKYVFPASIEFPSGEFNGKEPTWYDANMFWDYFNWNGARAIIEQSLFVWSMTGEEKYVQPLKDHLSLVSEYEEYLIQPIAGREVGSEAWAAVRIGQSSGFWNVASTWRMLSNDSSYDNLFRRYGTPFIKYRLTGDIFHIEKELTGYLETVRYNVPLRTSEAIHTDRVYIKGNDEREISILQEMYTGFGVDESASPYAAISWEVLSRDVAVLVEESSSDKISARLYSFADEEESARFRVWQLNPGTYTLSINNDEGLVSKKEITVSKRGERVTINIPSGTNIRLTIGAVNSTG